jgi:hypothetical protein
MQPMMNISGAGETNQEKCDGDRQEKGAVISTLEDQQIFLNKTNVSSKNEEK